MNGDRFRNSNPCLSLNENGELVGLQMRISAQSILAFAAPSRMNKDGSDFITFQGLNAQGPEGQIGYTVPNLLIDHAMRNTHVPPGFWRGVNNNQNAIWLETFIDQLAKAAGKDPLEFRRQMMANHPKHLGVLNAVADKIGWGKTQPAAGVFRGIARHMGYASFVAAAAEVSVSERGKLKVHRLVMGTDSGHGEASGMAGVAARYPAYDAKAQRLLNLEGRIQQCRTERQKAAPLAYESQPLLALTALVAHQSRGMPLGVAIDGPARPFFEAGRALYHEQQGQLDLSCAQCHEQSWGKRLRVERISQGHPNGFPAYRLEWQTMGSLHRRLRACYQGVRAEPPVGGSPELVNLELYLAWRAQGLPIETPAVRR